MYMNVKDKYQRWWTWKPAWCALQTAFQMLFRVGKSFCKIVACLKIGLSASSACATSNCLSSTNHRAASGKRQYVVQSLGRLSLIRNSETPNFPTLHVIGRLLFCSGWTKKLFPRYYAGVHVSQFWANRWYFQVIAKEDQTYSFF